MSTANLETVHKFLLGEGELSGSWFGEPRLHAQANWWRPLLREAMATALQAAHPDDVAVDRFAAAMKDKLASARAKGRGGWDDKEDLEQHLSNLLRAHVDKGDPRDVANFCCFLWNRGEAICAAPAVVVDEAMVATLRKLRSDVAAMKENPYQGDAVFRCGLNGGIDCVLGRIDTAIAAALGQGKASG